MLHRLIAIVFILFSNAYGAQVVESVEFHEKNFKILSYSSIKPNEFLFTGKSLSIKVNDSASPLIYPLKEARAFKSLSFKAIFKEKLKISKNQGKEGYDDFSLRVGVVYEGERTLNFFEKAIAANWIKTLFNLAPENTGVSEINFYNTYVDQSLKGQKREHPLSDLLIENFVADISNVDKIDVKVNLDSKKKVLALWISSDGDDTKSKFEVLINEISLSE